MGFFLVQWDGKPELGRFCKAAKLSIFTLGLLAGVIRLATSTIQRKKCLCDTNRLGFSLTMRPYRPPLVFSSMPTSNKPPTAGEAYRASDPRTSERPSAMAAKECRSMKSPSLVTPSRSLTSRSRSCKRSLAPAKGRASRRRSA
jgi:hypothetical protein